MKKYTIYYREKGNLFGAPIASSIAYGTTWQEALTKRQHHDKTWHSIFENGKCIITLQQVRNNLSL